MIKLFHRLSFKYYDLTYGQVDYPQLLTGTKDKGPDIPQLVTCSCGAWTNKSQGGICSKCKEQNEESDIVLSAKVVKMRTK